MTEKRYIYASVGVSFEILDSWFGYTGDEEPTEREIEEYDYLVIGLAPDKDAAEGICRRLNDQQDEINHLSNFGLHVMLDKKNKEIEQLKHQVNCLQDRLDDYVMVEKENEQLKSKLTDCNEAVWSWSKSYNRVYGENEQLKLELGKLNILYKAKCKTEEQLLEMGKEVEKEKEQLKQTNQRLNDELQECMGKLALKR